MNYVGNVTTKRAVFNSLVNSGPLVAQADNLVPLMLPDVFEDGGDPGTKIVDMMYHLAAGLFVHPDTEH